MNLLEKKITELIQENRLHTGAYAYDFCEFMMLFESYINKIEKNKLLKEDREKLIMFLEIIKEIYINN